MNIAIFITFWVTWFVQVCTMNLSDLRGLRSLFNTPIDGPVLVEVGTRFCSYLLTISIICVRFTHVRQKVIFNNVWTAFSDLFTQNVMLLTKKPCIPDTEGQPVYAELHGNVHIYKHLLNQ